MFSTPMPADPGRNEKRNPGISNQAFVDQMGDVADCFLEAISNLKHISKHKRDLGQDGRNQIAVLIAGATSLKQQAEALKAQQHVAAHSQIAPSALQALMSLSFSH